jgi:hypothetical protein
VYWNLRRPRPAQHEAENKNMPKTAKNKARKATKASKPRKPPALPAGELEPFDPIGLAVKQAMLQREVKGDDGNRPMNQADLAKAAKVRPVAIRQWLSGARAIRSHMASRCLEALGLVIVAK